MGLSDASPDQVTAEALRPLIARGLISACHGVLTLVEGEDNRRTIRVAIPSRKVQLEQIRVYLETRSAALAAIYQAALRSDRVAFVPAGSTGQVDVVLVDSTERRRASAHVAAALPLSRSAFRLARPAADPGLLRRHRRNAERYVATANQHPKSTGVLTAVPLSDYFPARGVHLAISVA